MSEEIKTGENTSIGTQTEKTATETQATFGEKEVQEAIKAALDAERRIWQSRFDTVVAEKKTVEGKALTVEQRLEQIEQERQRERLEWSRKEAKAKAQINDELDNAVKLYASNDPEDIATGAGKIKEMIDALIKTETEKAVKEALEKIGSQPTPKGGANNTEITRESLKTPEGRKAMLEYAAKNKGYLQIAE